MKTRKSMKWAFFYTAMNVAWLHLSAFMKVKVCFTVRRKGIFLSTHENTQWESQALWLISKSYMLHQEGKSDFPARKELWVTPSFRVISPLSSIETEHQSLCPCCVDRGCMIEGHRAKEKRSSLQQVPSSGLLHPSNWNNLHAPIGGKTSAPALRSCPPPPTAWLIDVCLLPK